MHTPVVEKSMIKQIVKVHEKHYYISIMDTIRSDRFICFHYKVLRVLQK